MNHVVSFYVALVFSTFGVVGTDPFRCIFGFRACEQLSPESEIFSQRNGTMQSSLAVNPSKESGKIAKRILYIDASETERISEAFSKKVPFVIENAQQNPHGIDVAFLQENYPELDVTCFNPESNSEHIKLGPLLRRILDGEKYRLRADVILGRRLTQYFDTHYSTEFATTPTPFSILMTLAKMGDI